MKYVVLNNIKCPVYKIMFRAWENLYKILLVNKLFLRKNLENSGAEGNIMQLSFPHFTICSLKLAIQMRLLSERFWDKVEGDM